MCNMQISCQFQFDPVLSNLVFKIFQDSVMPTSFCQLIMQRQYLSNSVRFLSFSLSLSFSHSLFTFFSSSSSYCIRSLLAMILKDHSEKYCSQYNYGQFFYHIKSTLLINLRTSKLTLASADLIIIKLFWKQIWRWESCNRQKVVFLLRLRKRRKRSTALFMPQRIERTFSKVLS